MNSLDIHIRYHDNIPFDFFEELKNKYPTLETFNLNWKCNLFHGDISIVTFENVKTFKLELEDKYHEKPVPPPFAFPILETFVLDYILHLTDEWVHFITKLTAIRSLSISTMFDNTMTDDVIARIAEQSNFANGLAFEIFGNELTANGVKNFIIDCRGLIKLSLNFSEDNADRFLELEVPGWHVHRSAESLIIEKI